MSTPSHLPVVSSMETLSSAECLDLLARGSYLGRVGFIRNGKPMILPVNYVIDGEGVAIRTHTGSPLCGLGGATVAFEVDEHRPLGHSGWSVLIEGTLQVVTDQDEIERLNHGPLRAWAWRNPDVWLRISLDSVSGRRIPES